MAPDQELIGSHRWLNCCVEHDKAYWLGGTLEEKQGADQRFRKCLREAGMGEIESTIFYIAVQSGGSARLSTGWKWGYGWKNPRNYSPLSQEERNQARTFSNLPALPIQVTAPTTFYKLFGDLGTRNYCREDILNRLSKQSGINPASFHVVKLESSRGRDAFQVFSPECKNGYFVITFAPTLAPDRCVQKNYLSMPDQVERIEAFGACAASDRASGHMDPRRSQRRSAKPEEHTSTQMSPEGPAAGKAN